MVDTKETAHSVLGIIGNVASCAFFLSSAPTVCEIIKKKSSGALSGDLYVFKLFNCLLWTLYGLPVVHPHNFWVVLTNAIGSVFALTYIIPYLYYASKRQRWKVLWELAIILSLFTLLVVLLLSFEHSRDIKIMVVGILCAIISSLMHLTLLSQMGMVLETKETKYMHPYSSVGAFLKGAVWTAYGIVNLDLYIMIPNGFGITIGGVQLIIFLILIFMRSKQIKVSLLANPSKLDAEDKNSRKCNDVHIPMKALESLSNQDEKLDSSANGPSYKEGDQLQELNETSKLQKHKIFLAHHQEFI